MSLVIKHKLHKAECKMYEYYADKKYVNVYPGFAVFGKEKCNHKNKLIISFIKLEIYKRH